MTLNEFLDQFAVTETFKSLVLQRHENGHNYHTARGSSWEDWPEDRFVLETAEEALDFVVWLWQVVERAPIFRTLAPKIAETCSDFITLCEYSNHSDILDEASEYP